MTPVTFHGHRDNLLAVIALAPPVLLLIGCLIQLWVLHRKGKGRP